MDFERFRVIADSVGAILLADISHPSGLIAKGLLNDPIPHCHIVQLPLIKHCVDLVEV
jgi:glycine hydroxymethyltransferase